MITRSKAPRPPSPLDWVRKGQDPPGTRVGHVSKEIGKGVFADKNFAKGEFLFEYPGQLKSADSTSSLNEQTFVFYFMCNGSHLCIDATDSVRIGKYANDEWKDPNAVVKLVHLENIPKLLIFARKNIRTNEEIRYDYGQKMATWRMKDASKTKSKENSQESVGGAKTPEGTPQEDEFSSSKDKEAVGDAEMPAGTLQENTFLSSEDKEAVGDAEITEGPLQEDKCSSSGGPESVGDAEKPERLLQEDESSSSGSEESVGDAEMPERLLQEDEFSSSGSEESVGDAEMPERLLQEDEFSSSGSEEAVDDAEITEGPLQEDKCSSSGGPESVGDATTPEIPLQQDEFPSSGSEEMAVGDDGTPKVSVAKTVATLSGSKEIPISEILLASGLLSVVEHKQPCADMTGGNDNMPEGPLEEVKEAVGDAEMPAGTLQENTFLSSEDKEAVGDAEMPERLLQEDEFSSSEDKESNSIEDSGSEYCPDGDEMSHDPKDSDQESQDDTDKDEERVPGSSEDESEEMPLRVRRLDILNQKVDDSTHSAVCTEDDDDSDTDPEEDEVLRDDQYKAIYMRKVLTSMTTKTGRKKKCNRVYNSRHCCPFCHKLYTNFSQHILGKNHEDEAEVKDIVKLKVSKHDSGPARLMKERERKKMIAVLRNRGDNYHNKKVLKKKRGELIMARRPADDQENSFSIDQYGPCPNCLEWLKLDVIPRHQSKCPSKADSPTHQTKGNLLIQSTILSERLPEKASDTMTKEVYPVMRRDTIGKLAQSDPLIVALGNQWLTKNLGNKLMRKYYVSAVMRLSSRLLLTLRGMISPSTGVYMEDYLHPSYFSYVAQAALKVAQQDANDEENLQAPSNAIKLSHDIKRLANIKLAKAIKEQNQEKKSSAQDFLQLMSIEWTTKLERVVLEARNVESKPLPLPRDIMKFSQYLTHEASSCDLQDKSYSNFRKVVMLTLASLISYNRRQPGEVQAIKLSSYFSRKCGGSEISDEISGDLSNFEKKLLEQQDLLEIRGKGGKFVPVIVPAYIKPLLEYITNSDVRHTAGIANSNNYVFANNRSGVIRGGYAMVVLTSDANLAKPERIRGTNMRRFMATMCQALNISPQEQRWVVDHMGHTLDVHNIHYKSTLDIIERVDISKLLLMMDLGQISRFKGKTLNEIKFEELLDQKQADDSEEVAEKASDHEEDSEEVAEEAADHEEDYLPELPEDEEDSLLVFEADRKKRKPRTCKSRHKWTDAEIDEVKLLFSTYFKKNKTPGEKAVKKAMALSKDKGGSLWKLPLKSIKSKVSWMRLHKK